MAQLFRKQSSVKLPRRSSEERNEQYNKGVKAGAAICPQCKNIHYMKKWHHPSDAAVSDIIVKDAESELCPACHMIKNNLYEGEIIVENFPEQHQAELQGLVKNFGDTATQRDPQDRLIAIEKSPAGFRITTTENQLAIRIAKKIKDVFNTVDMQIRYSKEPHEVSRAKVVYMNTPEDAIIEKGTKEKRGLSE